jgi:hypothetical protein
MDIVPFLIEKRLLEPTRPEPSRTSSDWLVWKSEQIASYISGYDDDHWACHTPNVTRPVRNPADRVVVPYDKLPYSIQELVRSFYPGTIEVTVTEEMKKAMIICLPPGFADFEYHEYQGSMAVSVPDIFMPPGHDPYDASIIERLPGRTHPHNPSNRSTIDNDVCMCSECKHMPGFINEAWAYMHVRSWISLRLDSSIIEFNVGPHQFRPLFTCHGDYTRPYEINIPVSDKAVSDEPDVGHSYEMYGGQRYTNIRRPSLTGLLAWIGDNLNRSGTARSLRKVIVNTVSDEGNVYIRFKCDAGANLFLLFSHSPVAINKKHASVVISYHDMCMVCRAWDSFQPRPNSDYLRSRGQSDIPPVFRSIFALANMGQFLTKPNQLESPLHQNLPTMPGAVVDLIGQYLCIGASSSDDPNGAKNSMSRPVAGTNAGTWSILFLAESFDPIVLDKICEFLYKR